MKSKQTHFYLSFKAPTQYPIRALSDLELAEFTFAWLSAYKRKTKHMCRHGFMFFLLEMIESHASKFSRTMERRQPGLQLGVWVFWDPWRWRNSPTRLFIIFAASHQNNNGTTGSSDLQTIRPPPITERRIIGPSDHRVRHPHDHKSRRGNACGKSQANVILARELGPLDS